MDKWVERQKFHEVKGQYVLCGGNGEQEAGDSRQTESSLPQLNCDSDRHMCEIQLEGYRHRSNSYLVFISGKETDAPETLSDLAKGKQGAKKELN